MTTLESTQTITLGACPHDCPDTCSMIVTVDDGRVTKVRGNPDHPFTQGGLCVKVTDFPTHMYAPDRVVSPLRRVGPKGEGRFEPISWDDALDEIADRYRSIIAEHGPEAILPYSYLGTMGLLNGLTVGDRFFNALGSSVSERTFCDGGGITGYIMTLGPTAAVDPESLVHSRYIIIWACNVLSNNLHLWPFIEEAQRRGAKVVCIDPVAHRTAKKADWHLPIRPGTDGALALAMMHVIIGEGLHDAAYVAAAHGRLRAARRARRRSTRRSGRLPRRGSRRRHPHAGPGVRRRRAVDDPGRRRPRAQLGRRQRGPCRVSPCRRSSARGARSAAGCCRCRSGRSPSSGTSCTGHTATPTASASSTSGGSARRWPATSRARRSRPCSSTTRTPRSSPRRRRACWTGSPATTCSRWCRSTS